MTRGTLERDVQRLQDISDNFIKLYEVLYRLKLGELKTLKYSWESLMTRLQYTKSRLVEAYQQQEQRRIVRAR